MKQIIGEFGGLITEVDQSVNPGAVDILNWDITYDKTLRKSKGYVLSDTSSLVACTSISSVDDYVELITNGEFGSSTSGWTAVNSILSIDTGRLKVYTIASSPHLAKQSITTTIGVVYKIAVDWTRGNANGFFNVGSTDQGTNLLALALSTDGQYTGTFTATGTTTYISLLLDGIDGLFSYFDNVSVRTVAGNMKVHISLDNSTGILVKDNLIQLPLFVTENTLIDSISNKTYKVNSASSASIVLAYGSGAYTDLEYDIDFNISKAPKNLVGLLGSAISIDSTSLTNYGSFSDEASDRIYSFIGNTDDSKSYLCYTDKDTMAWNFFEGASAGVCTDFGITHDAQFVKYNNEIIFVKGESKTIASQVGGCFTLNTASATINLYGVDNNPTGETIEVFGERLYVGNISKQENISQNGASWIQVSKMYPEKTDTTATIAASGSIVGTRTTLALGASHAFNRDDYVFVIDVTASAGTNVLNGDFWRVTETASQSITIDADTTDMAVPTDGTVLLRGNTWTPSYVEFQGIEQGGGMFRCDDNVDDAIVVLKKNFGSLFILREQNPYILSGDFSNGALAKQLNIPYKTLSKSTALTANGFYFISNFGLSMVDGQVIKDNPNQFSNIGSSLPTELIKTRFNGILNKNKCILNFNNRYVWLHDRDYNYTYSFDTILQLWTVYSGKLANQFFNINEDVYSINGLFIFKHDEGYNSFDLTNLDYQPLQSTYKTKIYDQDSNNQKMYRLLYALLEGVNSSDSEVNLDVQILYNSEASPRRTVSYNIKTGNDETWLDIATETEVWTDIATVTDTWTDIVGSDITAIERGTTRLGTAKQIQLIFNHNSANDGKISKIMLDYDIINIGTFKST